MALFSFLLTLLAVCYTTASHLPASNLTLPSPHIVIVGSSGAGKSSLAMAFIGGDVTCTNCTFPICPAGMDSCTKTTTYATENWLGLDTYPNMTVVDTPGFEDTDDDMDELIVEMMNILNNDVETADAIVLTIDQADARLRPGVAKMLEQLESMFGKIMWNNTMIEISKFSYAQWAIDNRDSVCEHDPNQCKNEQYYYNEINSQIEKRFHIGHSLSIVFIDSWAVKDENKEDETQQQHFMEETKKLWEFAQNTTAFKFKTIDEVLEENKEMRDEIVRLNDIIEKNITELQDRMTKNEVEFGMKINEEVEERMALDEAVNEKMDNLNSSLSVEETNRKKADAEEQENRKQAVAEEKASRTECDAGIQVMVDDINIHLDGVETHLDEKDTEINNLKNTPRFLAVSQSGGYIPTGTIKFDTEEIDVQDSFNHDTGMFQPSEDGLFVFFFNANVHSASANVIVKLNGNVVEGINHSDDAGPGRQLIGFWTMSLKANDQVLLANGASSSIYINENNGMYFMGFKLN